ncbi:MAG TPA: flagellar hook-associated protein FlgL [Glaciihabitans sp.]|jgi:flagellar hook-associated protein 3 FlgL|nr:flagellar hook-associated protein FlgL [Glaciihabitans sp.]
MITRVTSVTMMQSASRNMQFAASALAKLQDQAATQKTITRPSDDPSAAAKAVAVRSEQKATAQYVRNAQDGNEWLTTVDSTLANVTALLQRANALTIQGANDGALSSSAKEAIAVELDTIRDSLLSAANTEYGGRFVFAGNSAEPAFSDDFQYSGGQGTVERRIGAGVTLRVDADGSAIFGEGDESVFALLSTVAADLRSGVSVSAHLDTLSTRMAAVTNAQASNGARQASLSDTEELLAATTTQLEASRSSLEDIDLGEIVLELKMQETVYQAALAVTARALQPTLMDFLS